MGYPMTFQRFVKRNQLENGDYGKPFEQWAQYWQQRGYLRDAFPPEVCREMDRQNTERRGLEQLLSGMAGDLRRLEKDGQDENATCKYIAQRTGVDAEVVATILKEFIGW